MTTEKAAQAAEVARALMPAVNRYLLAVVECEVTAPRIEHMDRKLLESGNYTYDPKWSKTRLKVEGRLVDPRHLHLMEKSQWEGFYQRRRERVAEMGWPLENPDHCPLAIAEAGKARAAKAIVEAAVPFFPGLTVRSLMLRREKFNEFVSKAVSMVVNAPFYEKPVIDGA